MRWPIALLALALSVKASPTRACKCSPIARADLAQHAVFAGTAVEYLQREEPPDGSPRWDREMNAATRFVVDFSREFPGGASLVVMGNHYQDCNPWFQVGGRHLLVAYRLGDLLTGSTCSQMLGSELEHEVRQQLHLPADYFAFDRTPRPPPPEQCARPATLDDAFTAADAVLWSSTRGACSIPGTNEVEIAAKVRWSWKGAAPGDVVHLRVKGHPDQAFDDFDFHLALAEATNSYWPPAELLRRDGDLFVNDGCLNPHAPASLASGIEAVKRLFPLPIDYRSRPLPDSPAPLPTLSCSTLDQTIFAHSDATLSALARSRAALDQRLRTAPVAPPPTQTRGGAFAGCALVPKDDVNRLMTLSLLVLAVSIGARRRTGLPFAEG
jgi:hypothetical protein